jgi:hypothetical protein
MKNKKLSISVFAIIGSLILLVQSCKYDNLEGRFEREIYNKAKSTEGYVWFKYSAVSLQNSGGSGHEQPLLKTRYNDFALTQLDSVGKIKAGAIFPHESMVVKELLDNKGNIEVYAVLYKNSTHPNADTKGWVWGYYNKDGTIRISSSLKGKDCNGCHSQSLNEDYMLMNKYYP